MHHFHMHVIPRYEGGNAKDVTWSHSEFSAEELDKIREPDPDVVVDKAKRKDVSTAGERDFPSCRDIFLYNR